MYCSVASMLYTMKPKSREKKHTKYTKPNCLPTSPRISTTIRHTIPFRIASEHTLFTQPQAIFTQSVLCVKHEGEVWHYAHGLCIDGVRRSMCVHCRLYKCSVVVDQLQDNVQQTGTRSTVIICRSVVWGFNAQWWCRITTSFPS